jgi:D-glycero-alpha-D-manno-heptose-7-phosphate kinase
MRVTAASASAPTRIDLAGGTLDIWPISELVAGAITVNVAIELRAHARVAPRRDGRLVVTSIDRGRRIARRFPLRDEDASGPLSWLVRLAAGFPAGSGGLSVEAHAEAPAGAGLGGSSALGIATATALARACGERLSRAALLRRVQNLETREIRVPTGNQDYLAALHGGLAAYRPTPDGTVHEPIAVPEGLEARLVLAYCGEPRASGYSNWDMFRRFVDGEARTVARMNTIASIARAMRDALIAGDLDETGRLVGEEGRLRYALAPSVATPVLRRAGAAARRAGAIGVKVCGAGGGGCLVAFARAGRSTLVAAALTSAGARVLPCRIARRGVSVSAR